VRDRFKDDGRDLVAVFGERRFDGVEVVVWEHDRLGGRLLEEPAGEHVVGAHVLPAGEVVQGDGVVPAVVVALELHNLPAVGAGTGRPDGVGDHLRPREAELDLLGTGDAIDDEFGGLDLQFARADAREVAGLQCGGDRVGDRLIAVAEDDRTPCVEVVDVARPGHVEQFGAVGPLEADRVAVAVGQQLCPG